MTDFEKELEVILKSDPLGLLEVKPKAPAGRTADERLAASFEEINSFVRENGREPEKSRIMHERMLYSRLKGMRTSPEKAAALIHLDEFNLLDGVAGEASRTITTIDDVLEDDALGLLEPDDDDIFTLKNVPKAATSPDFTATRKTCNEFEQFEPLFKQHHADLATGRKTTIPFSGVQQISPGAVFLLQGMLVYVANIGKWEKTNFGNLNARLYCVFENGTESNMLLRSLGAALWKNENSREVIDADQTELLEQKHLVTEYDNATGHIYVLRSLSDEPKIKEVEELYKIGFSTQPVKQRIENAAQDPTFLMADVMPVVEYQTYNLNPQKMELLLHTFFAEFCLNLDVFDAAGKRHSPREWFVVPLNVIEAAVQLLISGEIVNYRYDGQRREIVEK